MPLDKKRNCVIEAPLLGHSIPHHFYKDKLQAQIDDLGGRSFRCCAPRDDKSFIIGSPFFDDAISRYLIKIVEKHILTIWEEDCSVLLVLMLTWMGLTGGGRAL